MSKLRKILAAEGLLPRLASALKKGPRGGIIRTPKARKAKTGLKVSEGSRGDAVWKFKNHKGHVLVDEKGWGGKHQWVSPRTVAPADRPAFVQKTMDEMIRHLSRERFASASVSQQMEWFFKDNGWQFYGSGRSPSMPDPFAPKNRTITEWEVSEMVSPLSWKQQNSLYEKAIVTLGLSRPLSDADEEAVRALVLPQL